MIIQNSGPLQSFGKIVLFPYDNHSMPFSGGVQVSLEGKESPCGSTRVVVGRGEPGSPDSKIVAYYGSVCQVGDELWMWYLGQGDQEDHWFERVCFAKSSDGYHWEKPELGLVEYSGNKQNNLVDLIGGQEHVQSLVTLHEPDDTARPFKMVFQCRKYPAGFSAAHSQDGLHWTEYPGNPVGRHLELTGLTKLNGCYYANGQGDRHGPRRKLATYVSHDFQHWSTAGCVGLRRDNVPPRPVPFYGSQGEQVHLGASLWNRGNVILGFYGMWHGLLPSNDRRTITMDLGLAVTNDALHFREPLPGYPIVWASEDGWNEPSRGHTGEPFAALSQGQGFANIGDETLFWYAPWPEHDSDGIRVAVWPRDRLGCAHSYFTGREIEEVSPHMISAPINPEGKALRLFVNADGLGDYSSLAVSVLDEQFRVVTGYSREQCRTVTAGLRQPVSWSESETISIPGGSIRIRVDFGGIRVEDARLYAMYLEEDR